MTLIRSLASVVLIVAAEAAFAQTPDGPAILSGGVGSESREQMRSVANDYSLHIVLATRTGSFLADVQVEVRDAAGTPVAQALSDGPLLYVDLPPGRYTVEGTRSDGPRATIGATVPATGPPVEVVLHIGETEP